LLGLAQLLVDVERARGDYYVDAVGSGVYGYIDVRDDAAGGAADLCVESCLAYELDCRFFSGADGCEARLDDFYA
jgi:hypothetical protein